MLLADYRSHLQATSSVASHCIQHSLSDKSDPKFASKCLHTHDLICSQCERASMLLFFNADVFSLDRHSPIHSIVSKARDIAEFANSSLDPDV